MADLKKGQRVTHPSVNAVLIVNSPASIGGMRTSNGIYKTATRKGHTNCKYQANGRMVQADFPTNELVPVADVEIRSSIDTCKQLLEQAVLKLMDRGIEQDKSIERVRHNFRV